MSTPESAKFYIIREMTSHDNNLLNIKWLCESAGVSRSGYYNWLSKETARQAREASDRADFALILNAYNYRGYRHKSDSCVGLRCSERCVSKYRCSLFLCPFRLCGVKGQHKRVRDTEYADPRCLKWAQKVKGTPHRPLPPLPAERCDLCILCPNAYQATDILF